MTRWKNLLVVLLGTSLVGAACQAPAPETAEESDQSNDSGDSIPVGLLLPFTGEYSWVGANVQPVVQMILDEEINADGGIGGKKVQLVQGDTEGVVDAGVAAAQKLIEVDGVVAVVGPTSLEFTGVRRVLEDSQTPMMSPTAGTTELDDASKELFYRTVPSDSLGGRAIVKAITDSSFLGADSFQRPALMVGKAPALVSFKDPIEQAFEEFGGELVSSSTFTVGKQSYRSEIQQVLAENPDVIILIGSPEDSARLMQNAFEAGYEGTWFVTQDQTNADFVELAGADLVEGIYGLVEAPFDPASDLVERFEQRFAEYSGGDKPDIFALNAYDAINVLGLAMLEAQEAGEEVTRESILAHIESVANPESGDQVVSSYTEGKDAIEAGEGIDYQGLVGPVDFDDFGNITAPFSIERVQEGSFESVAVIPPDEL